MFGPGVRTMPRATRENPSRACVDGIGVSGDGWKYSAHEGTSWIARWDVASEVDQEGRCQKRGADDAQPDPSVDEVGIHAKQQAGDDRHELGLPLAVHHVPHAEGARDDADDDVSHGGIFHGIRSVRSSKYCSG